MPDGYYELVLHGLPGLPKTAVGIEGRDTETGEMWRIPIYPNPRNPVDSLPMLIPCRVPFTRVVTADEELEKADAWGKAFAGEVSPVS